MMIPCGSGFVSKGGIPYISTVRVVIMTMVTMVVMIMKMMTMMKLLITMMMPKCDRWAALLAAAATPPH